MYYTGHCRDIIGLKYPGEEKSERVVCSGTYTLSNWDQRLCPCSFCVPIDTDETACTKRHNGDLQSQEMLTSVFVQWVTRHGGCRGGSMGGQQGYCPPPRN